MVQLTFKSKEALAGAMAFRRRASRPPCRSPEGGEGSTYYPARRSMNQTNASPTMAIDPMGIRAWR
jgi:hypothetical protein